MGACRCRDEQVHRGDGLSPAPELGEQGTVERRKAVSGVNNLKRLEEEHARGEEKARHDYLEARRRASRLEGTSLVFHARAGEEGKLFGSVTNADIADHLSRRGLDFEVDRRTVILEEPLKLLGAFNVPIRLHSQVEVEVEVRIERGEE